MLNIILSYCKLKQIVTTCLLGWIKFQIFKIPIDDLDAEPQELSIVRENANDITIFETSLKFLTKLNILLPYNLVIVLFGIHPEELET